MKPIHDYYYRFQDKQLRRPGRCRVRIYKRKNGTHVVLLTELATNTGESITGSCEHIATDLVATKNLNPKTTRWIQHESPDVDPDYDPTNDGLPQDKPPQVFEELRFEWGSGARASKPQWRAMDEEEAIAMMDASIAALDLRMGEAGDLMEEKTVDA